MRGGGGTPWQATGEWQWSVKGRCTHEAQRGETAAHADWRWASGVAALVGGRRGGFVEGTGERGRGGAARNSEGRGGSELPADVC